MVPRPGRSSHPLTADKVGMGRWDGGRGDPELKFLSTTLKVQLHNPQRQRPPQMGGYIWHPQEPISANRGLCRIRLDSMVSLEYRSLEAMPEVGTRVPEQRVNLLGPSQGGPGVSLAE